MKRAVLLSLLVHAGLFGLWDGGGHAPGGPSGVLQVTLVERQDSGVGGAANEAPVLLSQEPVTPSPARETEADTQAALEAAVPAAAAPARASEAQPAAAIVADPGRATPAETTRPSSLVATRPEPVAERPRGGSRPHAPRPTSSAGRESAATPTQQAATRQMAALESPQPTRSPPPPGRGAGERTEQGVHGGNAADIRAVVESHLQASVFPRFAYPGLARRRGWEGVVRVALTVEPDGRLRNVRVLETSGFKVLDRAALRDLRQVSAVPGVAASLGGRNMDVVLPVHYRLNGG